MLTKDTAICIRAVDYSETSQIVTFFTRETGKISAIAKGSKRPKSAFGGTIELFTHGQIVFIQKSDGKLAILTEFEQQSHFTHLSADLSILNCCLFGAELVDSLTTQYDPHPELFDNFLDFLQNTNEVRDTLSLLILFQLALLKEVGLQPILNCCANCKILFSKDWPEAYFSNSAKGLICRDCEASFSDKTRLTKQAANTLSNLKILADSDKRILDEIEKVLIYHFTDTLGRPPKMAKYILQSRHT